jgi:hypothetical protein
VSIAASSSAVRSKPKTSTFSAIRLGLADLALVGVGGGGVDVAVSRPESGPDGVELRHDNERVFG